MSSLIERCLTCNSAAAQLTHEGNFVEAINELNTTIDDSVQKLSVMTKSLKASAAPVVAMLLSNRAFNFLKLNCLADAERDARSATATDPAEPRHKQLLARVLYEMGEAKDAKIVISTLPDEAQQSEKMVSLLQACSELERIGMTDDLPEDIRTRYCPPDSTPDDDEFSPNVSASKTFQSNIPLPTIADLQCSLEALCEGDLSSLCNAQGQKYIGDCFKRVFVETATEVLRLRLNTNISQDQPAVIQEDCDSLLKGLALSFCSCFPPSSLAAAAQIFARSSSFPPFFPAERYRRLFVDFISMFLRHDRRVLKLVDSVHAAQSFLETFVPQVKVKEPTAFAMLPVVCALFGSVAPGFVQQFFSRQKRAQNSCRQPESVGSDNEDCEDDVVAPEGGNSGVSSHSRGQVHYEAVTLHRPVTELARQFSRIFVFFRLKSNSSDAQALAQKFLHEFVPVEVHSFVKQRIDSEAQKLLEGGSTT